MITRPRVFAAICGTTVLTLFGYGPTTAHPLRLVHPEYARRRVLRLKPAPVAPAPVKPAPVMPAPGSLGHIGLEWRPYLIAALQALQAADKAMHLSASPDAPGAIGSLNAALGQLQAVHPYNAERAKVVSTALHDTQRAINHLRRTPLNPGAIALTEDAIANIRALL